MALVHESENLPLSITITTLKGNPAKVDGLPIWAVSDPAVGTLAVAADGMSATFTSVASGSASVSVTVDADLGEGVRNIMGSLDIQVISDEAAIVTINAGAPVPQGGTGESQLAAARGNITR